MPIITLPDGNNLTFPDKVTGLDVAEKISKSLAKQAMIISVDGELKDLDYLIEKHMDFIKEELKYFKEINTTTTKVKNDKNSSILLATGNDTKCFCSSGIMSNSGAP